MKFTCLLIAAVFAALFSIGYAELGLVEPYDQNISHTTLGESGRRAHGGWLHENMAFLYGIVGSHFAVDLVVLFVFTMLPVLLLAWHSNFAAALLVDGLIFFYKAFGHSKTANMYAIAATAYFAARFYGRAAKYYEKAALLHKDREDYNEVAKAYDKAAEAYFEAGLYAKAAELYTNAADMHRFLKKRVKAINAYKKAAETYDKAGVLNNVGLSYGNAAFLYQHLRKYDEAINAYEKAAEAFDKAGDDSYATWYYKEVASLHQLLKDYDKARSTYTLAADRYMNLATNLIVGGDYARAYQNYQEAKHIYEIISDFTQMIIAMWLEASALLAIAGSGSRVLELLDDAVKMRRKLENPDLVQLFDAYVKDAGFSQPPSIVIRLRAKLLLSSAADIYTILKKPEAAQRMRTLAAEIDAE